MINLVTYVLILWSQNVSTSYSLHTSQRTRCFNLQNQLVVADYCKVLVEQIDNLWEKCRVLNVKPDRMYSNHWALEGSAGACNGSTKCKQCCFGNYFKLILHLQTFNNAPLLLIFLSTPGRCWAYIYDALSLPLSLSLLDLNKDTYTAQDMKACNGGHILTSNMRQEINR